MDSPRVRAVKAVKAAVSPRFKGNAYDTVKVSVSTFDLSPRVVEDVERGVTNIKNPIGEGGSPLQSRRLSLLSIGTAAAAAVAAAVGLTLS